MLNFSGLCMHFALVKLKLQSLDIWLIRALATLPLATWQSLGVAYYSNEARAHQHATHRHVATSPQKPKVNPSKGHRTQLSVALSKWLSYKRLINKAAATTTNATTTTTSARNNVQLTHS